MTAFILKYRVPAADTAPERSWRAVVQDAQRAVNLVRHNAAGFGINPRRVGIL